MDDLLGLNEINSNANISNSNCYFEEEDKKEELYIKMIEDRIMFKIRKEIIEPLISDFNVKIDINTRQILRLNEDKIELKEYLDNEKNKNIELTNQIDTLIHNYDLIEIKQNEIKEDLTIIHNDIEAIGICIEDNVSQIDILRDQLNIMENIINDYVRQTDKLYDIISKLKVYSPTVCRGTDSPVYCTDIKELNTSKMSIYQTPNKMLDLKILHLSGIEYIDFKYIHHDYVTTLIIEYFNPPHELNISLKNINYLPLLKIIEINVTKYMNIDLFIKELSLYEHNIQHFIFTDCDFIRTIKYQKSWNNFKKYCEENTITLKFTFSNGDYTLGNY